MKLDATDKRIVISSVLVLLLMTIVGAVANSLKNGLTQTVCLAFVAALANPVVYVLQHFDGKQKEQEPVSTLLINSIIQKTTPALYRPTRLRVAVAMTVCAVCCVIVLSAMQTATDSLLETMQNLELTGQLKITDYGWKVVGNVMAGLTALLVYIPAVWFFSVRFSAAVGYNAGILTFMTISFFSFLIRGLENYGVSLFSVAPAMDTVGVNIKNSFSNPRDHALLLAAQVAVFITLVLMQGLYMKLCSWIATRLSRLKADG